jgi:GT2 family glycosyltransferase
MVRRVTTISVCVPVYKAHEPPNLATLADGLDRALAGADDLRGEVVVALNGVTAQQALAPPGAVVVDLGINRGVAPGWNAAAQAAHGELLVFTNDDVVFGEGALTVLAGALREHPDAGVVGPVGTTWDLAAPRHLRYTDLAGREPGDVEACDVVSGFLMAMRRDVFELAGGFDEAYAPCSYEEVDICTTVSLRLGLRCYAVAGVEAEHDAGISVARPWTRVSYDGRTEFLPVIHRRNRRHFRQKWAGDVVRS